MVIRIFWRSSEFSLNKRFFYQKKSVCQHIEKSLLNGNSEDPQKSLRMTNFQKTKCKPSEFSKDQKILRMTIFQQNKKINPQKILRVTIFQQKKLILGKFWGPSEILMTNFQKTKCESSESLRILRNSEDKQCSTKKVNPQKILRMSDFWKNATLRKLSENCENPGSSENSEDVHLS